MSSPNPTPKEQGQSSSGESTEAAANTSSPSDSVPGEVSTTNDNNQAENVQGAVGTVPAPSRSFFYILEEQRENFWRIIGSLYPANREWFYVLPKKDQRDTLVMMLNYLKLNDDIRRPLFKLISYYWPKDIKLPVEPLPPNGAGHIILVQTFRVDKLQANKSLFLDYFLYRFYQRNMKLRRLAQGVVDCMQSLPLFEGLTPEEEQQARAVLGRYKCPRQETCPHIETGDCVFSHHLASSPPELPNYVCFNHLVHKCGEELQDWRAKKADQEAPAATCTNDECRFGLHVSAGELAAGFDTNAANQERIQAYRDQFPDEVYECDICRDNIRLDRRVPAQMEYCVFPTCNHVHCARCVIKFGRGDGRYVLNHKQYRCLSRCHSDKAWFQHYEPTIDDVQAKKELFATLPSSLVHTNAGHIIYWRYSAPSHPRHGRGIYIKEVVSTDMTVPLPSRIIDVMIRVKLDFANTLCTMAYFPPMLDRHFGLTRQMVADNLEMLTANGQQLFEFVDNNTFVPFKP